MTGDVPLNRRLITSNPAAPDPETLTTKAHRRFTAKYKRSLFARS